MGKREENRLFVVTDGEEEVKCGGCLWRVSRLYVIAKTQKEAEELYEQGEAGLCGDCISDLLVETGYKIIPFRKRR